MKIYHLDLENYYKEINKIFDMMLDPLFDINADTKRIEAFANKMDVSEHLPEPQTLSVEAMQKELNKGRLSDLPPDELAKIRKQFMQH